MQFTQLETIAQKIREQFLAGDIGDVATIFFDTLVFPHPERDKTNANAAEMIERLQPLGVAFNEIIVHRDDVAGTLGPSGENGSQSGGQSLAFAGCHLGQVSAVKRQGAHQLNGEWSQAGLAIGGFANCSQCGQEESLSGLSAPTELFAEFQQPLLQSGIGKNLKFGGLSINQQCLLMQKLAHFSAALVVSNEAIDRGIEATQRTGRSPVGGAPIVVRGSQHDGKLNLVAFLEKLPQATEPAWQQRFGLQLEADLPGSAIQQCNPVLRLQFAQHFEKWLGRFVALGVFG